ncbi:winged helix-turn-helix transcriptional regulator [Paraburkholderia fynbosensis]|uniref:winged helix-turn-helix transcriptional regulator n=1 Tax=Paraburkholderia fynbosensis TaxID=1200993 RepID=UPI001C2E2108
MLIEALRRLERNGLDNRRVLASPPVAVEYSITPLGRSGKHGGSIEKAQTAFDERSAWDIHHMDTEICFRLRPRKRYV